MEDSIAQKSINEQVDIWMQIAADNPSEVIEALNEILAVNSQKITDAEKANIHYQLADIYHNQKNQHRELRHLKECYIFYENTEDNERAYLSNIHLGRITANLGKYAMALNYLMKSLQIAERLNNVKWQIRSRNNLGLLHGRMFNYDAGIKQFLEAKSLFKHHAVNDPLQLMRTNCFLGNAYTRMRLFDRAADHFISAYSELKNDFSVSDYLMPIRGMAYLHLEQNELSKAKIYLDKADQYLLDKNDNYSKVNLLLLKGSYFKLFGDSNQAIEVYLEALQLAEKERVMVLQIETLQELATIFEKTNDYKNSIDYWKRYYELKSKNVGEESLYNVQSLELRYKFDEAIKAKSAAEEAVEMKEHIMLNLSHEIRTPMNSISGFLQLLERTELNPEQKEYVSVIEKSTSTILDIIEDVLQLTKISTGNEHIEEKDFSLETILEEVKQIISLKCEQNGVEFIYKMPTEVPEMVRGDAGHLKQILINLCNNAVKFSNKTPVTVEVINKGYRAPVYDLQFRVIDQGIGISPDHLPQIFDSFSPSSFVTNKIYGGTGLGLNICKKLTDMMHGNISVTSEIGKGTTFYVYLPLKRANQITKPAKRNKSIELIANKALKILLVEDNLFNQKLATKSISIAWPKAEIDIAENGLIAIEFLHKKMYDIILMDIQMPHLNGYETTEIIRQQMPAPINQIPILAQTANVMKSEMDKCFEVGMNDYISKPFAINILMEKIQNLVKGE
jgi:signal transduction histidine kinase